jgi:hypothetical protein
VINSFVNISSSGVTNAVWPQYVTVYLSRFPRKVTREQGKFHHEKLHNLRFAHNTCYYHRDCAIQVVYNQCFSTQTVLRTGKMSKLFTVDS